ncbi:MAG TPA: hypothetical protein VIK37_01370 [Candidatus Saccharimonadales bacterium]
MSKALGASEERIELYLTYSEGVPQLATPRFAKSPAVQPTALAGRLGGAKV